LRDGVPKLELGSRPKVRRSREDRAFPGGAWERGGMGSIFKAFSLLPALVEAFAVRAVTVEPLAGLAAEPAGLDHLLE